MKAILTLCCALVFLLSSRHAIAGTGCPGNGPTNSHVVVEYLFMEGDGVATANDGTDGVTGNAALVNGAAFDTNAPPQQAGCRGSIRFPATGSGSTTPAVETDAQYDPLAGATNFVLMAWVKRESSGSSSNTSARIISDTSSTSLSTNTAGFEFRFSGIGGTLALRVNGNELSTTVGGIAPNSNQWHHVAVVYDGSRPATNGLTRHAHFYVDGVQCGLGVSNATLHVAVGANDSPLTVGNSAVSRSIGNLLVGKVAGVRILRDFATDAVGDGKTNKVLICYMNADRDRQAPTIVCPESIMVAADPGQNYASNVDLGQPGVSDDCGVAGVTNDAPSQFPMGTTTVTWTVTDVNGNTNTCHQSVIVVDLETDSDGDGVSDWEEVNVYGTNSYSADTDADGMSDLFELQYGLNPNSNADAACKPNYW